MNINEIIISLYSKDVSVIYEDKATGEIYYGWTLLYPDGSVVPLEKVENIFDAYNSAMGVEDHD
ncbi:MAG: hypothetical protein OIF32_04180 [Campylobacterales bacterium]|nr:hypothetical protein [Campylobacterales bacterium]